MVQDDYDLGHQNCPMSRSKVFGIGLNKTGTTSLKLAFEKLGFRHLARKPRLFKHWKRQEYDAIFERIEDYETFEDWPWPLMVPELLARYPDAKFILTRRASPEKWVESLKRHAERTNPSNNPRHVIFGRSYPHGYEAEHIRHYDDHLKRVRALFAGQPDHLVELCWEDGDGWTELCDFLALPVPRIAFPHANKSTTADGDPEFLYENQRRIQLQLKKLK